MTDPQRLTGFTHEGLSFEVLDRGPLTGPTVVLLHGFPQDATAFDEVAARLADAGVRTLAPHQRGYSSGARPRQVTAYGMDHLVGDVIAMMDAAGVQQAHVVGHDWGAGVAWSLPQLHPERALSLVALSVPHPRAMAWAIRHDREQLRHSWYMFAFQTPLVPERLLARMLRRGGLRRLGVPAEAAQRYAERLGRADQARGALAWYRAALRRPGSISGAGQGKVDVPTTMMWGRRDPFVGRTAAEGAARFVGADYRFVEVDAGHWLPEKRPDLVVAEILARVHGSG